MNDEVAFPEADVMQRSILVEALSDLKIKLKVTLDKFNNGMTIDAYTKYDKKGKGTKIDLDATVKKYMNERYKTINEMIIHYSTKAEN